MKVGFLLVVFAVLGAVDQYVGSIPKLSWGVSASLLSAPWLLIAFIAGWTRRDARTAMLLGLGCTYAALLGYGLMTLSPIENAHLTLNSALAFCRSEAPVLVGGLATGPLFGWFGYRWRLVRAWMGALITALALRLEPVADSFARPGILTSASVTRLEVAAGVLMAAYVVVTKTRQTISNR